MWNYCAKGLINLHFAGIGNFKTENFINDHHELYWPLNQSRMKSEAVLDWEMHEDKQCINCKEVHHFDFCPNCGQPYEKKKISFGVLYDDFKERVLGLDGKFIQTVITAVKDCGSLTMTYIQGNRRKYVGPVSFFFISLTIYFVIMTATGNTFAEMMGNEEIMADFNKESDPTQAEIFKLIGSLLNEYFKVISLFSVLITGFFLWLFNLKKGMNYLEFLVFAFYYNGLVFLISPLQFLSSGQGLIIGSAVISVLSFVYFIWAYLTFDKRKSVFVRIIKAILIQVATGIVIAVIASIAGAIYILNNKELLEQATKAQG